MTSTGTVVVGADGSPESRAAVVYALRDAARRGARLRIIAAAPLPEYWAGVYGTPAMPTIEDITADLLSTARRQLDEVLSTDPQLAGVPVTVEAATGGAGQVLVDAAEGADELVLGHRGRGSVSSALLGSVGLHCVLHATCPVTVVRPAAVTEHAPDAAVAARA